MTAYPAADRPAAFSVAGPVVPSPRLSVQLDRLNGAMRDYDESGVGVLVEQALELVAEAEHLLAEQRARIADLERLSVTDEMTGLFNRRGVLDHLRREIDMARRHGEAGVVVLCDIDGLKATNDTHGHAAGDALIRAFATLLRDTVRRSDIVGRLGGDEFAVVLARCRPEGARRRIAALRERLAAEPVVPAPCTATAAPTSLPIALAASFGHACYTGAQSEETVLARADRALYADKRRRRGAAAGAAD